MYKFELFTHGYFNWILKYYVTKGVIEGGCRKEQGSKEKGGGKVVKMCTSKGVTSILFQTMCKKI
jgi:hypothetical protein